MRITGEIELETELLVAFIAFSGLHFGSLSLGAYTYLRTSS